MQTPRHNLQLWPFWFTLQRAQQRLTSWFFLAVIYWLGIGVTALAGRWLGQRFMAEKLNDFQLKQSSWQPSSRDANLKKMY